jgi:hypothetical protein
MRILLLPMVLYTSFVLGAPSDVTKDDIVRNAGANGALIAMAQVCKLSDAEVRNLANRQEMGTLALANANSVVLDSATYREYVIGGIKSTYDTLALMPRSGPSYDDNCREIREKVAARISN